MNDYLSQAPNLADGAFITLPTPTHQRLRNNLAFPDSVYGTYLSLVQTSNGLAHKCTFDGCGHDTFSRLDNGIAHVRSSHFHHFAYICGNCFQPFSRKGDADRHCRTKNGESSFACRFCGRALTREYNRQAHEQRCYETWMAQLQASQSFQS